MQNSDVLLIGTPCAERPTVNFGDFAAPQNAIIRMPTVSVKVIGVLQVQVFRIERSVIAIGRFQNAISYFSKEVAPSCRRISVMHIINNHVTQEVGVLLAADKKPANSHAIDVQGYGQTCAGVLRKGANNVRQDGIVRIVVFHDLYFDRFIQFPDLRVPPSGLEAALASFAK